MRPLNGMALTFASAVLGGVGSGYAWRLGNAAADAGIVRLILLALPFNLLAALVFYYGVRGAVAVAGGGLFFFLLAALCHLVITFGVASTVAGVAGDSTGRIGAHVFSWGASYAYGQAFHDVRHGTWLGDDG